MKRAKQFGALTLMLIFPIFVIWFLRSFGENKFTIPVFHQNAAEMSSDLCVFPEGQHHIPPFDLVNQQNKPVSEKYLNGHITVVNFFFTTCPTICPDMTAELRRVQHYFSEVPYVRMLSVSIDPEYDQPEVLSAYARLHGADEGQWNFVTGDKGSVYELVRCGFILPVQDRVGGADDILHSDRLILVDSQRRIRGYYSGTDPEDVDRLVTEMKILLQEEQF
jgi:protein SCO1/2